MMKVKGETLFNLLILVIFSAALLLCFDWPVAARRYPLLISSAGICFSGWLLVTSIRGRRSPQRKHPSPPAIRKHASITKDKEPVNIGNEIGMIIWIAVFGAAILLFGFWLMIAIFIPLFMRVYGGEKWRHIFLYTLIMGISIYVTFMHGVHLSLFGGVVGLTW